MRTLHLYRPRLPGTRAQAIQVLHACHALAEQGHEVTLLADRGDLPGHGRSENHDTARPNRPPADLPSAALAAFDLKPLPGLHLSIAPTAHGPTAGLWFRARVLAWWSGSPGVVLARDKKRLGWLLRLTGGATAGTRRHRIVLEAHELDSAIALDEGRDPAPAVELERWLLARADGLITNCGGTLELWQQAHGDRLPAAQVVAHNAVSASRRRGPRAPDAVIRCVGSLRAYKGVAALALAAGQLPLPLELIGGSTSEQAALGDLPGNVRLRPPVPYTEVPDLLAHSAALILPLADNLFGRKLTSPLKLWDYLATSTPIVAPDLPTVREIATLTGATIAWYQPKEPATLVRAVQQALVAGPRIPTVRTWQQRATQLSPVLLGVR